MHTIIDGDGRYCRAGDIMPDNATLQRLAAKSLPPASWYAEESPFPPARTSDGRFNRQPDPTPDAIAAGCESIQATWSDRERAKRAAAPVAWTVPVVGVNLEGD